LRICLILLLITYFGQDVLAPQLMLSRVGGRAGVHGVHVHRFRHSFALEFLRRGGNVHVLKEIPEQSIADSCFIVSPVIGRRMVSRFV